jgi:adenylate cyclase
MCGIAEQIDAVVWFNDLHGFTRITDTAPEQVIPLLNDYSDAIFLAIHEHGGEVLKLIGDGTLAIFTAEDRMHVCSGTVRSDRRAPRSGVLETLSAASFRLDDMPYAECCLLRSYLRWIPTRKRGEL